MGEIEESEFLVGLLKQVRDSVEELETLHVMHLENSDDTNLATIAGEDGCVDIQPRQSGQHFGSIDGMCRLQRNNLLKNPRGGTVAK